VATGARADGRELVGSREERDDRDDREEQQPHFFLLLFFAPFAIVAPFA
jgi:hypothetical protein